MARESRMVPLRGSERKPLEGARVVAPAPASERLQVTVRIRPKTPLPGAAAWEAGSGLQQPISHEQYEAAYGADPKDLTAVEEFARRKGLNVVEASIPRRLVILDGTVDAYSKAFGVKLDIYEHPGGTYRGRSGPIQLPSELDGIVEGVFGLDNRPFAKPRLHRLDRSMPHAAGSATFDPPEVAALYNFPSQLDGSGQCIGIIELGGGYRPDDLRAFFNKVRLPLPVVVPVSVDEGVNRPGDDGSSVEVVLDIEVAGSVAPRAKIAVYFTPDATDQSFLDAITQAIHDTVNNPSVISISWGGPEGVATDSFLVQFDRALQAAAMLGITVCVAAGDDGAADIGPRVWDGRAHVDFPASSPFALGCGGTTLKASGRAIASETVWNQGFADLSPSAGPNGSFGATGGGVSEAFMPPPTWQANANVPPSVNTGQRGRGVPDVAGDGDGATGYNVMMTIQGQRQTFAVGGTSAVAPLWAGLIALINQSQERRVGFINPALYNLPVASHVFHDITQGNNRVGDANVGYDAKPGWDPCTGLGTPDGSRLLASLNALPASPPHKVGKSGTVSASAAKASGAGRRATRKKEAASVPPSSARKTPSRSASKP
jgi:kumamolisin